MQNNQQREIEIYKPGFGGYANDIYQRDLKKRLKDGWTLISCTESGKDVFGRTILTAIYERGTAMPALNIPNLPILLSMLSPQEKAQFEAEVQVTVNRWLATKATGQ